MEIKEEKKEGYYYYKVRYKFYKIVYFNKFNKLNEDCISNIVSNFVNLKIDWKYLPIYLLKSLFKKKKVDAIQKEKSINIEVFLRNKGFTQMGDIYENGFTCVDLNNKTIWHKGISKVKTKFALDDIDIYINNFVWR
jgi:hypothetical protein